MESYKMKLFNLFMKEKSWSREDTLKSYDYLHGAFYGNEISLNECELSTILHGVTDLCELLHGEGMDGSKGVQDEMRSSILAVMIKLNVITKDQKHRIIEHLYKSF